tara:strand:- start:1428 stop:2159 length:732 start_codon:yes stop_codon:yes gene_type:complete
MGLETGTTIEALDADNPLSGDDVNRGDDHLRLIKAVLQAQFPGVAGNGFATAILSSEAELNTLQGQVINVKDQFDLVIGLIAALVGGEFPSGTNMIFRNLVAPTGWTIDATYNDSIAITAAPAVSGGTDSPVTRDFAHVHSTTAVALNVSQLAAHTHGMFKSTITSNASPSVGFGEAVSMTNGAGADSSYGMEGTTGGAAAVDVGTTSEQGSGATHTHGNTGQVVFGLVYSPKYYSVILCNKD